MSNVNVECGYKANTDIHIAHSILISYYYYYYYIINIIFIYDYHNHDSFYTYTSIFN